MPLVLGKGWRPGPTPKISATAHGFGIHPGYAPRPRAAGAGAGLSQSAAHLPFATVIGSIMGRWPEPQPIRCSPSLHDGDWFNHGQVTQVLANQLVAFPPQQ